MKNEKIAGIILAGGGSKRLGEPKQLLDWFGKTFINQIIETALNAKLAPVIVVTGAYFDEVENNITALDIIIARNPHWDEGQSSSIRKGLEYLAPENEAFIFMLCDQPQITSGVIKSIICTSKKDEVDIVSLKVGDKTCPPILFKKKCVNDLLQLEGDRGGKELMKKYQTEYVNCEDERMLLDSDTQADYGKLLKAYE